MNMFLTTARKDFLHRARIIPLTFQCRQAALSIRNIRRCYRQGMRQTLRVNRYMPLDTAHFLAGIVAFFHGCIRVLHTLCINDQESGSFMAPPLATRGNHLIFSVLSQGCCHSRGARSISGSRNGRYAIWGNHLIRHARHNRCVGGREWHKRRTSLLSAVLCAFTGSLQQGKEGGGKLCATYIAQVGLSAHADSLQQRL